MEKKLLKFLAIVFITIILGNLQLEFNVQAYKSEDSLKTEQELKALINKYGEENITVERAASFDLEDSIDIDDVFKDSSENVKVFSNNNEIVKIENGKIIPINEGTTFIIMENSNKYYIKEIYICDYSKISSYSTQVNYNLVYIDAGHGGSDPGAVGNNIKEKDLNLAIALKVRDKLKAAGLQVVMNRETDVFVNYKDTAAHANSVNPELFVSIHNNSSTSTSAKGVETFYTKDIDKKLANEVHSRVIKNTGAIDRGIKWDEYYVTNHTTMPAILLEGGFISNKEEADKLKLDSYKEKIANAIVNGVIVCLNQNDWVNSWAKTEIKYAMENNWVQTTYKFRTEDAITRAEFIKIVNKAFNYTSKGSVPFTDVKPSEWYYEDVAIALKNGVISDKNSTFRPTEAITREEVAVVLTNIKNNKDSQIDKLNKYTDKNEVSNWAISSVEGAIEAGYMGQGVTAFKPKSNITRAETVVTLYRLIN